MNYVVHIALPIFYIDGHDCDKPQWICHSLSKHGLNVLWFNTKDTNLCRPTGQLFQMSHSTKITYNVETVDSSTTWAAWLIRLVFGMDMVGYCHFIHELISNSVEVEAFVYRTQCLKCTGHVSCSSCVWIWHLDTAEGSYKLSTSILHMWLVSNTVDWMGGYGPKLDSHRCSRSNTNYPRHRLPSFWLFWSHGEVFGLHVRN